MIFEGLFVLLVVAAGASDLSSYRIPNAIVIALVALFAIDAFLHRGQVGLSYHLGAAAFCLALGIGCYALHWLGAGDAKLIAAVALWTGFAAMPEFLFLMSLTALAAMLLLLGTRYALARANGAAAALPRVLRRGEGIPYGVGIAMGAILAIPFFPPWLFH